MKVKDDGDPFRAVHFRRAACSNIVPLPSSRQQVGIYPKRLPNTQGSTRVSPDRRAVPGAGQLGHVQRNRITVARDLRKER